MPEENLYDKLRIRCHDQAFHTFGHRYIFDERIKRFSRALNWLKVFGIIVPAAIGATVLGYGIQNNLLTKILYFAVPVTIIQFLISILAVIYKWDDELMYSFEASQDYSRLTDRFKNLGEFPPATFDKLGTAYDLLNLEFNSREQQDTKHNIAEWELRKGMRFSLRENKRNCTGCFMIPLSMKSTDCDICGKFSLKYHL